MSIFIKKNGMKRKDFEDAGYKFKAPTTNWRGDKFWHFEYELPACQIEMVNDINIVRTIVRNELLRGLCFGNTHSRIVSSLDIILSLVSTDNIRYRVYGEIDEEDNAGHITFMTLDLQGDINKLWNKYLETKLSNVSSLDTLLPECQELFEQVKIKEVIELPHDVLQFTLSAAGIFSKNLIGSRNVQEISQTGEDITYTCRSDWGTLLFKEGTLSFSLVNPGTGVKGEKLLPSVKVLDTNGKIYSYMFKNVSSVAPKETNLFD